MMRGGVGEGRMQLVPVFLGKPVAVAECLVNVRRVALVGRFLLLLFSQDAPINDRTIGDNFLNSWIEGRKNCRSTTEAATDHEDLLRRQFELLPKGDFAYALWQFINHVAQVLLR